MKARKLNAIAIILLIILAVCAIISLSACKEKEEEPITYTVSYSASEGGNIDGETVQVIEREKSSEKVTAVPDEGYKFVDWSDGVKTAVRKDRFVTADISVKANFAVQETIDYTAYRVCDVEYTSNKYGSLYFYKNTYKYGGTAAVEARPNNGYDFFGWSDGVETAYREDLITSDFYVEALFGSRVKYTVDGNKGGKIVGESEQKLVPGEDIKPVTAVPDTGYVFTGWSDLQLTPERNDGKAEKSIEYVAYFEPIEVTFNYDYGTGYGKKTASSITVNRNKLSDVRFAVPTRENYTFCGWYTEPEFKTKIANEDGRLMLGYYTFNLETDTIYAKWQSNDENVITYKVLNVMIDETHASLLSWKTNDYVDVNYKMSAIEKKIFSLLSNKMSEYINEWFEGRVVFEFDTYYTTIPTGEENMHGATDAVYHIFADDLPEISDMLGKYHCIMTIFGMNDYDMLLNKNAGIANTKYGMVRVETFLSGYSVTLNSLYKNLKNNTESLWLSYADAYYHEFAHTAESYYSTNEIHDFHKTAAGLENTIKYLLCQYDIGNGELVGVPFEYWIHEIDIPVTYVDRPCNGRNAGTVKLIEATSGVNEKYSMYVSGDAEYGSNITVEAVPEAGYKFLKWSDGVTTARRTDTNIISYLRVEAIFVEDN